jgi:metal-dependent HD superfamily phosphatase/phosphodiesterase
MRRRIHVCNMRHLLIQTMLQKSASIFQVSMRRRIHVCNMRHLLIQTMLQKSASIFQVVTLLSPSLKQTTLN